MWVKIYVYLRFLFRVIYLCFPILSYQQLASFSQGKSKHIYKKSKATALLKYYYLISLLIAIYNQRSAVDSRQSAVSGQWSAVTSTDHCAMRSMSFATPASSIITVPAVISAVAAASAVVITALLSCVISPLESSPNETISSAVNSSNILS